MCVYVCVYSKGKNRNGFKEDKQTQVSIGRDERRNVEREGQGPREPPVGTVGLGGWRAEPSPDSAPVNAPAPVNVPHPTCFVPKAMQTLGSEALAHSASTWQLLPQVCITSDAWFVPCKVPGEDKRTERQEEAGHWRGSQARGVLASPCCSPASPAPFFPHKRKHISDSHLCAVLVLSWLEGFTGIPHCSLPPPMTFSLSHPFRTKLFAE